MKKTYTIRSLLALLLSKIWFILLLIGLFGASCFLCQNF